MKDNIKTAEEILTEVVPLNLRADVSGRYEDYAEEAMRIYAKQFIDLAAGEFNNVSDLGASKHYIQESILKIKQLIK